MIARYGFNELVSFIAGWAICLDYLILVALCSFAATDYLGAVLGRVQHRPDGVPDRRRDRAVRLAAGHPRRRAAALRAGGGARPRRPRPAGARGRARARAAVRARRAAASVVGRGVAVAGEPRVRVPARARGLQRDRRVLGPGRAGEDRARRAAAADRRAAARGARAVPRHRAHRLVGAAADGLALGRGAAAGRRRRVLAGLDPGAAEGADRGLGRRDLHQHRAGGDARPVAARLRAVGQPADPVRVRLAAPHAGDAGGDHRASAR